MCDTDQSERRLPLRAVVALSAFLLALAPRAVAFQDASGAPAAAPTSARPSVEERLRGVLEAWLGERELPGVTLGVVLPGGRELALAAGVASLDRPGALAPEARMLSGSVGKTYVAAAALRLAAQKKLDLDATAWSFLHDVEGFERLPNARSFTLRQLLRHQSGMPRYEFAPEFWQALLAEPDKRWRPEELLAFAFDVEPPFAPGEGWSYSDTNYIVVGMVLERVTGEPFYEHVRRAFLEPLGLRDTLPSDRRELPGMAQGHVVLSRTFGIGPRALADGVFTYNPQFEWCGGGWATTALDLARWARALYSGAALPEGALEPMLADAAVAAELGPGMRYGLGVILWDTPLGPARGHRGFMPGYQAACVWLPDSGLALAVLLNSDDKSQTGRLETLLERLAAAALAP